MFWRKALTEERVDKSVAETVSGVGVTFRASSCIGVRPELLANMGSAPSLIRDDIIGKSCLCTARCKTLGERGGGV